MIIIVTGTPGTGKTTIAKALAKDLKFTYIDVNEVIDKNKLKERKDQKRDTYIVDEKKLAKALMEIIKEKKDLVIDSHMAHCLEKKYVDFCIVTKCELKRLKQRLEKRGYSPEKVRENMDAEIFDVCLMEAVEAQHNIIMLDTTNSALDELITIIKDEISKNKR